MTTEIITLTVVAFGLSLYAAWSFGRQRMASKLAVVSQQLEEANAKIERLEEDRTHDRQLINILQADRDAMRLQQMELQKQVTALENAMQLLRQEKAHWQTVANEARMGGK